MGDEMDMAALAEELEEISIQFSGGAARLVMTRDFTRAGYGGIEIVVNPDAPGSRPLSCEVARYTDREAIEHERLQTSISPVPELYVCVSKENLQSASAQKPEVFNAVSEAYVRLRQTLASDRGIAVREIESLEDVIVAFGDVLSRMKPLSGAQRRTGGSGQNPDYIGSQLPPWMYPSS